MVQKDKRLLIKYAYLLHVSLVSLNITLAKVEAMDEPIARGSCGICQKGDSGEFQVPASVGDLPLKARKTPIREEVSHT